MDYAVFVDYALKGAAFFALVSLKDLRGLKGSVDTLNLNVVKLVSSDARKEEKLDEHKIMIEENKESVHKLRNTIQKETLQNERRFSKLEQKDK